MTALLDPEKKPLPSILLQFLRSAEEGEGDVICPECKQEIGKWYDEASQYLEKGECPFCACDGIELYEDDVDDCWHDRCHHCPRQEDCRELAADAHWESAERLSELNHYRCCGDVMSHPLGVCY